MKKAKWVTIFLIVSLLVISGCSSQENGSSTNSSPRENKNTTEDTLNENEEIVEIKFTHIFGGSKGEAINALVEGYNNSQNKVVVTAEQVPGWYGGLLEKLQALAVSKQLPDVTLSGLEFSNYMNEVMPIVPAQDFIDKENMDVSDFIPSMLVLGQDENGKQMALPFAISTPLIYVNKDHFKDAGIDFTEQPQSWDQIRKWARQLSDNDRKGIFFQMDFDTWMFQTLVESHGGKYASLDDKQVSFNKDAGKQVLQYWVDMVHEDRSYPLMNGDQAAQSFQNGQLSMLVASTGNLTQIADGVSFDLGIMLLPEEGRKLPAGGSSIYVLASTPEREAAAWDFVKYATSPEGSALVAEHMGYMSVRESVIKEDGILSDYFRKNPLAYKTYRQLEDIVSWHNWPGDTGPRITKIMMDEIQAAFIKEKSVDEALEDAASQAKQILGW